MSVELGQGTWGPGAESKHWILYDRFRLDNATLQHTLFNAQVGDVRQGAALTIADTNNFGRNIPSQNKFTAHKLWVRYLAEEVRTEAEVVSILDVYEQTQFRFKINGKDLMFEIPMWRFMGGLNVINAAAAVGNSPINATIFEACWPLKIPLILQELTPYQLEVEHVVAPAAGLANDRVSFEFEGRLDQRN